MKNKFKLDGCTDLIISTEGTQHTGFGREAHVGIEVLHTPMTMASSPIPRAPVHPPSIEGFRFTSLRCDQCALRVVAIDAPGSVHHDALYEPVVAYLGMPGGFQRATAENFWPGEQNPVVWRAHECRGRVEPEAIFAHTFKPSEARAIASMILLAANEARG